MCPAQTFKFQTVIVFHYLYRMNIRNLLFIFLAGLPVWLTAQEMGPQRVYQMSGLVVSQESSEKIPYVRVQVNHTRQGTIGNAEGFYSIPVTAYDTLYFSHVGYHSSMLVMSEYLKKYKGKSQYLYSVNYMREDTLTLDITYIFPYNTPEELKTAVVNMDVLNGSPDQIARQNLDPEVLHAIIQTLPKDGEERLMVARQRYHDYYQNKNLLPGVGLDAVAAMRLLQHIVEKSKKRNNKDLNYWEN